MKFLQIAFGDAGRTEHSVGTRRDRMQVEFLFGGIQKAHCSSQILPAILDFLEVNASGWLVIVEFARNLEFLARQPKGI
jgi:hypothetical protein